MEKQHQKSSRNQPASNRRHLAYHYTTLSCAEAINYAGEILPATKYVPAHEQPVVWFSRNPVWEATAGKGYTGPGQLTPRTLTFREMSLHVGIVRFAVDTEGLIPWPAIIEATGMKSADADRLTRSARRLGSNPRDWLASLSPVPLTAVQRVEFCGPDGWVPAALGESPT